MPEKVLRNEFILDIDDLEVFKEYGDYWSKGITYYLS